MSRVLVCLDGRIGLGGTFIAYWNLYKELTDEYKIDFVTFRKKDYGNHVELVDKIRASGGEVYEIIREDSWIRKYKQIKELLKSQEYDVIHINASSILYFVLPLLAACERKIPIRIVHAHSNGENSNAVVRLGMNYVIKPYIARKATHFLACSVEAGNVKFSEKVFSPKGRVLNNAIDAERFSKAVKHRDEAREKLNVAPAQILMGSVGRCELEKNQIFLIDVLQEMVNAGFDAKLLIVGDGAQKQACILRAKTLHVGERVVFLGNQPNVEYWLSAMDIFLFPSLYEGFGIAALEAQAAGLNVIASSGVSSKVNVTGNVTFMKKDAQAKAWAEQIQQCLKNKPINSAEKIKEAGYDIHSCAMELKNLYSQSGTAGE